MRGVALSRLVMPLLAVLALTFLVAMVLIGAQPIQRQLVKFEANGVLHIEPQEVIKITLSGAGRQAVLTRSGEVWTSPSRQVAITPIVAAHLDTALKMLHRSAPVRELAPEDVAGLDTRPFGLEEPVVVADLSAPSGYLLTVEFGAHNPEGFLQYMRIKGDPKVYLMSRFVGAEWTAALEGLEAR